MRNTALRTGPVLVVVAGRHRPRHLLARDRRLLEAARRKDDTVERAIFLCGESMTEIFEKRLADAFGLLQSDLPAALAEYRAIRDDAQRAGDWSVSCHAGSLLVLQLERARGEHLVGAAPDELLLRELRWLMRRRSDGWHTMLAETLRRLGREREWRRELRIARRQALRRGAIGELRLTVEIELGVTMKPTFVLMDYLVVPGGEPAEALLRQLWAWRKLATLLRTWADRDAATHTGVVTAKAAGLHHERRRFARLLAQDAPSPTTLRELADAEAAAGDGPRARNALRRAISLVRTQNDGKALAELTERLRVLNAEPRWSGPGRP